MNKDTLFLKEALIEAQKGFDKGEVPVGAVLVKGNQIIARAHNLVETNKDATAHAEILCVRQAAKALGNWRLLETTLYTTIEPCLMCTGSIILSRIGRIVWGAFDLRHGGGKHFEDHPIHQVEISKGVLEDECAELMRRFFKLQRMTK